MMNEDSTTTSQLRDEVAALLADALRVAEETGVETGRVRVAHADEIATLERDHEGAMARLQHDHTAATNQMTAALASRDVIGQAKGIIMSTMHCSADRAFELLVAQSQSENRKVTEIAAEVAARAARHPLG